MYPTLVELCVDAMSLRQIVDQGWNLDTVSIALEKAVEAKIHLQNLYESNLLTDPDLFSRAVSKLDLSEGVTGSLQSDLIFILQHPGRLLSIGEDIILAWSHLESPYGWKFMFGEPIDDTHNVEIGVETTLDAMVVTLFRLMKKFGLPLTLSGFQVEDFSTIGADVKMCLDGIPIPSRDNLDNVLINHTIRLEVDFSISLPNLTRNSLIVMMESSIFILSLHPNLWRDDFSYFIVTHYSPSDSQSILKSFHLPSNQYKLDLLR